MLLTIEEHGLKIARNSVFDCHFLLSDDFRSTFVISINVFDCRLVKAEQFYTDLQALWLSE